MLIDQPMPRPEAMMSDEEIDMLLPRVSITTEVSMAIIQLSQVPEVRTGTATVSLTVL